MCYEGGIREFVTWINRNKDPLHEEVIYMAGAKGDSMAEVAMQYNDGYNETMVSFANNVHTPEGGMHEEGFKPGPDHACSTPTAGRSSMLKDEEKVSGEDCREGLTVRHLRQADRGPVRGPDQGQAGQQPRSAPW